MAVKRDNSGADYTLKVGLDLSPVEKAQSRIEAIFKRTGRIERGFQDQRVSAATKVLQIEQKIAALRTKNVKGLSPTAGAMSLIGASPTGGRVKRQPASGARESIVDTAEAKRILRTSELFQKQKAREEKALIKEQERVAKEQARSAREQEKAQARKDKEAFAAARRFAPAPERIVSTSQRDTMEARIELRRERIAKHGKLLGEDVVIDANQRLDHLQEKIRRTSSPKQFVKLRAELASINRETDQLIRNNLRAEKSFDLQATATKSFTGSLMNLARSYLSIFAIIEGARIFIQISKQIDTAKVALLGAAGSAQQAAADFKFIKTLVNELGLELLGTAAAFGRFNAAAKLGGLSDEQVKKSFTEIAKAVAAASLSAERSTLVFQAFQQVMSKGVLSMEEVRQQIGESLPLGMAALEKATGKSGKELTDFISSGKAISKDILPLWTAELAKLADESGAVEYSAKTLNAQWNRFLNSLVETIEIFNEGGLGGTLVNILKIGTDIVKIFNGIAKAILGIGKAILGVNTSLGEFDKTTGTINTKLGIGQRFSRAIQGTWDKIVGSIKVAVGLLSVFSNQLAEKGILNLFEAARETGRIVSMSIKAGEEDAARIVKKEQERREKLIKEGNSVKIEVNNQITSNDPQAVADKINSSVNQAVGQWFQTQYTIGTL